MHFHFSQNGFESAEGATWNFGSVALAVRPLRAFSAF